MSAAAPKLSVVIPTYNRLDILFECLRAIEDQAQPPEDFEVLLVDDGSTDGTGAKVAEFEEILSCPLRFFQQKNSGPATARNVGIKNARGEIVLFLGDDIILSPGVLQAHIDCHAKHQDEDFGVLGHVTWSPEIEITPFMKWLESGGPQFHFWAIEDPIGLDPQRFFYTANVSVKRAFLVDNDLYFDEEFPHAACEDIEFGKRLRQSGLRLEYLPDAVGHHHHYTSLDSSCRRMITVGRSSLLLDEKLGKRSKDADRSSLIKLRLKSELAWKGLLVKLLYVPARYYEKRELKKRHFNRLMKHYQRIGVLRGRMERVEERTAAAQR